MILSNWASSGVGGCSAGLVVWSLSSMRRKTVAYIAPFLTFMLFTGLTQGMDALHLRPWGMAAMYLIFPLQTVVCAGVLAYFWRDYGLKRPRVAWVAVVIGVLAAALWVSPQEVFH